MDKIKCNQCQKEFQPKKLWARYCSIKCRNAWHYGKTKEKREAAKAAQSAPAAEPATIAEPVNNDQPVPYPDKAALEEIVKGNGPGVIKDIDQSTGTLDNQK